MSDKRQQLIETALELFYQEGVQSIGINEVLKVSGVAKKTLYHHFTSKEALVLATLETRNQRFSQWLTVQIASAKNDQELVEHLFQSLKGWFEDRVEVLGEFRGCFFINTAAEFRNPESEISRYCRQHKSDIKQVIRQQMATYADQPDETLLERICLLKEGAITQAYVAQDLSGPEQAIELLKGR